MIEIITLFISIVSTYSVSSGSTNINMLGFEGETKTEYFEGKVLPGGVDTQHQGQPDGFRLSARYMLEGTDCDGKPCKIFIENNSVPGEQLTKPEIVTDSKALSFLNDNDKLHGKIDMSEGKLVIRLYADEETVPEDKKSLSKK